jgi:peptidoglycan/LPS O-acetylase OafA/YrhL
MNAWGGHGVDVFFVISGFLITHLLLQERKRSGTVTLLRFYRRRAERILPAYCFFLLVVVALLYAGVATVDRHGFIEAITYTYNLFPHSPKHALGLVWSLCV